MKKYFALILSLLLALVGLSACAGDPGQDNNNRENDCSVLYIGQQRHRFKRG